MAALRVELSRSSATPGANIIGNFHQIAEADESCEELDIRDPFHQTEVALAETKEELAILNDTL